MSEIKPGDRVRFPSRRGGQMQWIYGTAIDSALNNDIRICVKIDFGQRHASGAFLNTRTLRYRNRSQIEKIQ